MTTKRAHELFRRMHEEAESASRNASEAQQRVEQGCKSVSCRRHPPRGGYAKARANKWVPPDPDPRMVVQGRSSLPLGDRD